MLITPICSSQTYPSKPIRTLLTITGGADILARMVAQDMTEALGQPVIIEIQSAAAGAIASDQTMRAAPDGHTLLMSSSAAQMNLSRRPDYDVMKSFTPITLAAETILAIVSNAALPVNTMKELVEHARRNPGKVFYSTSSIGGNHHLSGEQVRMITGIDWIHTPYKGGTQALMDTVTGQVQVNFAALSTALPQVKAGKLKLLAVNNDRRYHVVPDVPTISEQVPGYQAPPAWLAYLAPPALPGAISSRLSTEIVKSLKRPELQAKADGIGFVVRTSTPQELADKIRRDSALVNRIIDAAGIKLAE